MKFVLAASMSVAVETKGASPESLSASEAFKQGAALMEKGRHKDAIPYLKWAEKEYPDNPDILWNLGIANTETGSHHEALSAWLSYRKASPDDWLAGPKVIQAQQALGDIKSRDAELKALYASRESGKNPKLQKADRFCREQFVVEGRKVIAFEYFDPKDPKITYYRFSVLDQEGKEESYISLGSYKTTVEIARELGELKSNERLYHLDEYQKSTHRTFGFFKQKPSYDDIRKSVPKILTGEMKSVSGSRFEK